MSTEDKEEIYYNLEDDLDQSPLNYASLENQEETEDEITEEKEEKGYDRNAWCLLFSVMFNPVEGWKKIRRVRKSAEKLQSGCFYPLLALLALSNFTDYIYSVNVNLSTIVTKAAVAFVSYFFGYYCILFLENIFFSKPISENFDKDYGKSYIIIGLSTLSLFAILINILPMLWPILIFLPLWTLYLLYKGSKYFKLPESQALKFIVLTCLFVVGMPILIDWGLNEIMPY